MRTAATILMAALLSMAAPAQTAEDMIAGMLEGKPAEVGVAWIADGRAHAVNNAGGHPLMSVFKTHVAIAALRQMQRGGIPTDTLITVKAGDMLEGTYSPMLRLYGKRGFTIRLDSLLHYSVALSDNNACDIIIRLAGGIEAVDAEMRAIGLADFSLTETEAERHPAVDLDRPRQNGRRPRPRHDARPQDGHRLHARRRHDDGRQRRRSNHPARRTAHIRGRAGKGL